MKDIKVLMQDWMKIYAGEPRWKDYSYVSIAGMRTHNRKLLNMGKIVSAEVASMLWSEYPTITVDGAQELVNSVLEDNNIYSRMSDQLEYQAALGGMAIKGFYDGNSIKLDFITADNFEPIDWDGNRITAAKFYDRVKRDKTVFIKVETHRFVNDAVIDELGQVVLDEDGIPKNMRVYTITHELYRNDVKESNKIQLSVIYPDLLPVYQFIGLDRPLFVYSRNPVANNLDTRSPISISMFANAIDTLESIDTVFDALNSEIVLGKKRIIVPESAIRKVVRDGREVRYFDPSEEIFQAMDFEDIEKLKITDNSAELRVEEIVLALNTYLDILAAQVGFSAGTFSFDGKSFKTATEIVSENSKTYKTKNDFQTELTTVIKEVVRIIVDIYNMITDENTPALETGKISVTWFDNLFDSDGDKLDKYIKLVDAKLMSKRRALKEVFGYNDDEIDVILKEIASENNYSGGNL